MVYKVFNRTVIKKILLIKLTKSLTSKHAIIFSKNNFIPSIFRTFTLKIHKGHIFRNLYIDRFCIGRQFGEFAFTRKPHTFIKKKKKSANTIRR